MGMLPSQASGLCACTYHFFYNSPYLGNLVALQAALTCLGNTTMAFAAFRIFAYERERQKEERCTKYTSKGLYEVKSTLLNRYDDLNSEDTLKAGVNGGLVLGWKETVFNAREVKHKAAQRKQIVFERHSDKVGWSKFRPRPGSESSARSLVNKIRGELYLDLPFTALRTGGSSTGIIPYLMILGPPLVTALSFPMRMWGLESAEVKESLEKRDLKIRH